jgi:hypothetical protein
MVLMKGLLICTNRLHNSNNITQEG